MHSLFCSGPDHNRVWTVNLSEFRPNSIAVRENKVLVMGLYFRPMQRQIGRLIGQIHWISAENSGKGKLAQGVRSAIVIEFKTTIIVARMHMCRFQ